MIFQKKQRLTGILSLIFVVFLFLISCKKEENNTIETGTVTDIDGNTYRTVKIGEKWWMAENLKVKRYRNGDYITFMPELNYILDTAIWNHLDSGAYCIIDNSDETSQNFQGKKFGYLYNWFTVTDNRNIAPEGWHVPSDAEWLEMETYIGMNSEEANKLSWRGNDEGNKLKMKGPEGWNASSNIYIVWGTNESGFSAIGGGCCMFNGVWGNPGTFSTGFWWTSSATKDKALYRHLDYNKPNIFRYYGQKTYGFSIRCVKD